MGIGSIMLTSMIRKWLLCNWKWNPFTKHRK